MKSPAQWGQRWQAGAAGGQQSWTEGIQTTSVDVMGRAIANKGAAVAGYTASITSGAWERAIASSGGTANWKSQSLKKAANYATGIAAGGDKYNAFANKFAPALEAAVGGLPARGPAGSGQNEARVLQLMRTLHQRKGEFKG